jgi:hypothetical protein
MLESPYSWGFDELARLMRPNPCMAAIVATATSISRENTMIAHRRTWFYRLAGQKFAHAVTFKIPVTATMVRDSLRKTVGLPLELWGRSAH